MLQKIYLYCTQRILQFHIYITFHLLRSLICNLFFFFLLILLQCRVAIQCFRHYTNCWNKVERTKWNWNNWWLKCFINIKQYTFSGDFFFSFSIMISLLFMKKAKVEEDILVFWNWEVTGTCRNYLQWPSNEATQLKICIMSKSF